MTRGDNIRRTIQTDEGLADFMIEHGIDDGIEYCKSKPECDALMEDCNETIPDGWCRQCLIEWMKEENNG